MTAARAIRRARAIGRAIGSVVNGLLERSPRPAAAYNTRAEIERLEERRLLTAMTFMGSGNGWTAYASFSYTVGTGTCGEQVLNNLGQVVRAYTIDGDGVPLSDFASAAANDAIPTADAGEVRALTINSIDDQGRVYRSQVYSIDQTNGTSGLTDAQILALPSLSTDTFFDHRGNAVAVFSPGGQVAKDVYDGAGRLSTQYVTDGGAVNNGGTQQKDWSHATSVTGDIVLTQTENSFDGDSNVVLTTTRDRFDNDASSATGALGSPTSGTGARVSYAANYFDAADRPTDQVNVGTNGGAAYTRPSSVPTRSDTVLVTHTDYNLAGDAYKITDPRQILTQYTFDMLGRKTFEIDASDGGSPAIGVAMTGFTYDGNDDVLTSTGYFPGTSTPNQVTKNVFGVGGTIGTNLFSNDLVAKVEYPDKTTGVASSDPTNDVSSAYDLLGETLTSTDQNGTVHTFSRDILGRETLDAVTTLGSGVDGSIRAHGFSFNALGLPYQQSSYSDSAATTVVNQVEKDYDGFGQLIADYQAHNGSVSATSPPVTQYVRAEGAGNSDREMALVYPNGRTEDQVYGGQVAVTSIAHGTTTPTATTATATTAEPHGLLVGSKVTISGASPSAYDGTFTVTSVTDATHFTYTMSTAPATNASGNAMLATGTPEIPITSITHTGTTATITLASSLLSGLSNGTQFSVTIAGATPSDYNGTYTVTVTSATTLTYTLSTTPLFNASGVDMVMTSPTMTLDSAISRVGGLEDHAGTSIGTVVEGYSFLGLDTIVIRNRPQEKTQLSYVQQTGDGNALTDGGDGYTGLDRFNRIIDQNWINYGAGTTTDRFQYAYDRDSNVLYEKNLVNGAFSRLFHANGVASNSSYDSLNRLTGFARGTLSASGSNGTTLDQISSPSQTQSWNLDALGNWSTFNDSTTTSQSATYNGKNQYATLSGGTATASPVFDNNGNMVVDQTGKHYHYDAWNQLVTLKDSTDSTALITVAHDADERMIKYSNGSAADLYFDGQQQIESRYANVYNQYVWGLGYVDDIVMRDRNQDGNTGTGSYGEGSSGLEERVYAQQDANWDVTSIYNMGTSSIPERFSYNPYGSYLNLNGSWATYSDTSWYWNLKFQGARYESAGGFYFMGLRLESVALGRWMQPDPAGYIDSSDLYQLEDGNSVSSVDPTGLIGMWREGQSTTAQFAQYAGTEGFQFSTAVFHSMSFGITVTRDGQSIPSPAFAMGPGHAPGETPTQQSFGSIFMDTLNSGEAADSALGYLGLDAMYGHEDANRNGRTLGKVTLGVMGAVMGAWGGAELALAVVDMFAGSAAASAGTAAVGAVMVDEGTTIPQTLYHYTTENGMNGILDDGALNPSLKSINPSDVRYGNGQYLSDIVPGTKTPAQLSRQFLNNPFCKNKFTHYVGVDVRGLNVIQGRPGVYVVPNEVPLDLTGRIVSNGKVIVPE